MILSLVDVNRLISTFINDRLYLHKLVIDFYQFLLVIDFYLLLSLIELLLTEVDHRLVSNLYRKVIKGVY